MNSFIVGFEKKLATSVCKSRVPRSTGPGPRSIDVATHGQLSQMPTLLLKGRLIFTIASAPISGE